MYLGIKLGNYFLYLSVFHFHFLDENGIGVFQSDNFIWSYPIESFFINKFDIRFLNKNSLGELDDPGPFFLVFREERYCQIFTLEQIFNNQLNRLKYSHSSGSILVIMFPGLVLKHSKLDEILISLS